MNPFTIRLIHREPECSTSPVPEVAIKGRSEPASTAPRGEYIFAQNSDAPRAVGLGISRARQAGH